MPLETKDLYARSLLNGKRWNSEANKEYDKAYDKYMYE